MKVSVYSTRLDGGESQRYISTMKSYHSLPLIFVLAACGDTNTSFPSLADYVDTSDTELDLPDVGEDDTGVAPDDTSDDVVADVAVDATPDTAEPDAEDTGTVDAEPDTTAPDAVDDAAPDTLDDVESDAGTPGWLSGPPDTLGPYAVETLTVTATTSVQDVELTVYLPDGDGAPYPIAFFNHGFQMSAAGYPAYGQRLASHGIVAVLPTIGDNLLSSRTHNDLATIQSDLNTWAEDAALSGPLAGQILPELLGAGGHSRGGKAVMLNLATDDRVVAAFLVDPVDAAPPFGGNAEDFPSVTPELMGSVTALTGYIGAGRGGEATMGPACAPSEDNYHAYFVQSASPSFELVVPTAGHNDFVEVCDFLCDFACVGGDDRTQALNLAIATMTAFYKVHLAGDESYRSWIDGSDVPSHALYTSR